MMPLLSLPPHGDSKPKAPNFPPGWRWVEYDSRGFLLPAREPPLRRLRRWIAARDRNAE
jgi:hypothetical protein